MYIYIYVYIGRRAGGIENLECVGCVKSSVFFSQVLRVIEEREVDFMRGRCCRPGPRLLQL